MAYRIKIEFPKAFSFQLQIPVRISDINYGGHVGNDSMLAIAHEARIAFLAQHNMTELDAGGVALIMADAAVQYRGEAFHGDILSIEICVGEVTKKSFELYYKLTTHRDNKSIDIAYIKTGLVCYNYSTRKMVEMGNKLEEILLNN